MRKKIFFGIFGMVVVFIIFVIGTISSAQQDFKIYYKINLNYQNGDFNVSSVEIEFSQEEIESPFGIYVAEVLDFNNEILNITFFDVPNKILWDGINPETGEIETGGVLELNQTEFEIFVPYYENAREIIFYDGSLRETGKTDISSFSRQKAEAEMGGEEAGAGAGEGILGGTEERNILDVLTENWWSLAAVLAVLIAVFLLSIKRKR